MAECPFCAAEIEADHVIYGGTCPRCFAEIPGEEAPTDPGAEIRAEQERKDRRGSSIRAALGLAAMLSLVSCTGVIALGVVLWPDPVVAVMDFDEYDYPMPELVAAPQVKEPAEVASAEKGSSSSEPSAVKPRKGGGRDAAEKFVKPSGVGEDAAGAADLNKEAVAAGEGGTRRRSGTAEGPARPRDIDLSVKNSGGDLGLELEGPSVQRRGEVLSDPDDIRQMIASLMSQQIPGLNNCYNRRLKVDPGIKGRWLLKFTVAKDGHVKNAQVVGRDRQDEELEECLAAHLESRWRFDRISRDQPVQRTLTFRPG